MKDNRRDFLKKGALLGLSGLAGSLLGKEKIDALENISSLASLGDGPRFIQQPLPYAYNALEPFIDAKTMEIHYSKHHKGYVDKLNAANLQDLNPKASDAENCKKIGESTPAVIRNNLGGHYNHTLFWQLLKPNAAKAPNLPGGKLAEALVTHFKSTDAFKKEFSDTAMKIFGSGWCWLVAEGDVLKIVTTPNQDNPLMNLPPPAVANQPSGAVFASQQSIKLVLALDVWEHAYYLKHQNMRADYIADWWNVVNWQKAEELFSQK